MMPATIKVKHVCPHGHEFYANMCYDEKRDLQYADWSNNLCTVNYCDTVSRIDIESLPRYNVLLREPPLQGTQPEKGVVRWHGMSEQDYQTLNELAEKYGINLFKVSVK